MTMNKSKTKFVSLLAVSLVLVVGIIFTCVQVNRSNEKEKEAVQPSSQSDYPQLEPPEFVMTAELDLAEIVSESTLVIDGIVEEVLPIETRVYTPEKGSAEEAIHDKIGVKKDTYDVRPIKLKINKTLKGTISQSTVTMYLTPIQLDCTPAFQKGDRLIFMLSEYDGEGYATTTLQDSFYYVASDGKVYPAMMTKKLTGYSGMALSAFEKEIKSIS